MWFDRFVKFLLPREEHFFEMLERGAACVAECGDLLVTCCDTADYDKRLLVVEQLSAVEDKADKIIVEVYEALSKTFVTPIDRSDIYELATDLEDITDDIFAIALQFVMHALDELPAGSTQLARIIQNACNEIKSAVFLLRSMKAFAQVREHCKRINTLEHEGDEIFRLRTAELFRTEKDAIKLIKHKEFLEGLEQTLDGCDDMANALETIVIKNG